MPVRWWWVRHGPTHQKTLTGWRDVPADLFDTGKLTRLADFLPADALVVSSDLLRARATADAIADGRERLPHDPALREMNFGDWDGRHFSEIAESHPQLSREFWEAPGDTRPPNGESWNDLASRVGAFTMATMAKHPGREIIAVAHIGVILTQVQIARAQSPAEAMAQPIGNLSVTSLTYANGWTAELINHEP